MSDEMMLLPVSQPPSENGGDALRVPGSQCNISCGEIPHWLMAKQSTPATGSGHSGCFHSGDDCTSAET